ncbi:MAG: HesA/MoeB/ThiF family protein [Candidatus Brockarchaeota archaeon]|nr:HesA/MoeB/ThiF family protein [Candidatus Brockarchaeota archaeon]
MVRPVPEQFENSEENLVGASLHSFSNMPKNLSLSNDELEFYSRQIVFSDIGYEGQIKLKNAKVCIVGLGGLGSPAALQLAAMGVGHIRLVDHDVVETSNLQRQYIYSIKYLGYPKVEVAAKRLKELNPNVDIEPLPLSLNYRNADEIIEGMDVIIDGFDRMGPRYAVNRACHKLGVPYVYGAAIMTFGNASTIIPGETPCLECFQGGIDEATLPTCATVGVHPSILNIVASIEVSEAVRIILGKKPLLAGKLLYCDISEMSFESINLSRVENCPVCGSNPVEFKNEGESVFEVCGREGGRTFLAVPRGNLNLDIDKLFHLISSLKDFNVEVKADLGITFTSRSGERISILKSGIMIIANVRSKEEVYRLYDEIVVNGLGVSACESICEAEHCQVPSARRIVTNCPFL